MSRTQHALRLGPGASELSVEAFLANLPRAAGVYLMFDASERVIYIGKARDLSKRVRSYFREPDGLAAKERALIKWVARLECMVTDTEAEALVLEASLVKHHKPRYNIYLKDDKSYPYIQVSNEEFPRIRKTRRIVRDGSRYYGPFISVKDMNAMLKTASRLFYARSCDEKLPFPPHRRECLDYHIGRCLAPCTEKVSAEDYSAMINQAERLLSGRPEHLATDLEERMHSSAEKLDFERAALLRDQIRGIKRVAAAQRVVMDGGEEIDAVALVERAPLVLALVLEVRSGKLVGRRAHRLTAAESWSAEEKLAAFIKQHYLGGRDVPPTLLLNRSLPDSRPLADALSSARGARVELSRPLRGDRRKLIEMAETQGEQLLHEHALNRSDRWGQDALRDLAAALELEDPPARIEGFDISHVQGAHAVAGMVVFIDGGSDRSEYRRFKIRGEHGNDDFASMREVVSRRYERVREEGLESPGLILIDGGKGQLSAAVTALEQCGMDQIPVFGLAKRLEEVFRPGSSNPIPIAPASTGHLLLRRVRDEAHRYAVTYHRSLRGKAGLESQLDAIPGVGAERRRRLLTRFGSVSAIEAAGYEAVAAVPGIGHTLARRIILDLSGH